MKEGMVSGKNIMAKKSIKIPELLAPAGSLEKLKIAVHYGAGAVYLGGGDYSLRAHAVLDEDDLEVAIGYAHDHGVKAFVTVNIFAHNQDLVHLEKYLSFLGGVKPDGLIISDPGIFRIAKNTVPDIPIHISTQANITNQAAALFWQDLGADRVNLAREISRIEMEEIRKAVRLKLEVFVHGALCISYSGRCSLSLYMTGRDANMGNCAHPCRYNYRLEEEKRPGEFLPVEEDSRGTYIFNSKDLCLLKALPALINTGVDSLKIEGRMKSIYYVGTVVRLYRAALDYIAGQIEAEGPEALAALTLPESFFDELPKIGSRGYTENFFNGPPDANEMLYEGVRIKQTFAPIGVVKKPGPEPLIETRNPIRLGEMIEYLGQGLDQWETEIIGIESEQGDALEKANPGNVVRLRTSPVLEAWEEFGLVRRFSDSGPMSPGR